MAQCGTCQQKLHQSHPNGVNPPWGGLVVTVTNQQQGICDDLGVVGQCMEQTPCIMQAQILLGNNSGYTCRPFGTGTPQVGAFATIGVNHCGLTDTWWAHIVDPGGSTIDTVTITAECKDCQ